jgi:hypothetical protein
LGSFKLLKLRRAPGRSPSSRRYKELKVRDQGGKGAQGDERKKGAQGAKELKENDYEKRV